ncbi:hypothetical protein [Psychroserpens sp. SPM9]|uniref:hypothetical protein n=1 Tax=Psychroserpens sp. SPM9 TaxID=2975598 RepID=UPI0021A3D6EA|nr:hypothetical protein [Psychroserpens sp. SPM9]MDG5492640.1 hypothetical protein [Psychroserpens sp. SPM9]
MKQIILIALIFLNLACGAQKVTAGPELMSCESGTEQATTDFNNDHYKIYRFGMIDLSKDRGFHDFYKTYLQEKHQIKLVDKGDAVMPNDKCYSDTMETLIKKKFGEDVFELAKKQAKIEFEKQD